MRVNNKTVAKIFSIGFIIIGLVMVLIGACMFKYNMHIISKGIKTKAIIVNFEKRVSKNINRHSGNSITYAPVFTFKATDGKSYTITSKTSTNNLNFTIGEKVSIIYDPADVNSAEINSFSTIWVPVIVLLSMGICFIFFGLFAASAFKLPRLISSLMDRIIPYSIIIGLLGALIYGNIRCFSNKSLTVHNFLYSAAALPDIIFVGIIVWIIWMKFKDKTA